MSNLETAKGVIKEFFDDAQCGIYNCRNLLGDYLETLYEADGLTIDICYDYSYFEVFGLTDAEFSELKDYYRALQADS